MSGRSRRTILKRTGIAAATATLGVGAATADRDRSPGRGRRRARGRIDLLGQELPPGANPDHATYTFGHVSEDGEWGAVGSWPGESLVASTLYDLSDLENPRLVHEVDATNALTRTNDLKFDPNREGIYVRSLEANDAGEDDQVGLMGVEVVDFGYGDGSPEEPEIVARLETPNTGVHKLDAHPEEYVLYLIDKHPTEPGIFAVDFGDPTDPTIETHFGPNGYVHDVAVEAGRDALHAAYIFGENVGYATFDISNPLEPTLLGFFDYDEQPDYAAVGEPGFELCHQAYPDPERDLAIVGDEVFGPIPGGKHVFDVGWDEGSLEDPQPIGFTASPDARNQNEEPGVWTGHFHDVVHDRDEALLVDGGYSNGVWVANITDPTDPAPTERYATDDGVHDATPFAWGAHYNEARDFVFAADSDTGAYAFDVSGKAARGKDGGGPGHYFDFEDIFGDGSEPPHEH